MTDANCIAATFIDMHHRCAHLRAGAAAHTLHAIGAGLSPGFCDATDGKPPGTLNGGETGSMHGYFIISTERGTSGCLSRCCVASVRA
jgi:hypothetical protein